MSLEDALRQSYRNHLDPLDLAPGDVAGARLEGARLRTRRRLAVVTSAAVVVALAVGGSLLGTGRLTLTPTGSTGHWRELPAAPLSPRAYAESVWTGREVLVLGGETDPCPPNADSCATTSTDRQDGAAYDPATDTWRTIPPSPVPVGPGDRLVVANGVVVLRHHSLQGGSRWFTYEPDHNRWSGIAGVPAGAGDLPSAYGSRVYMTVHGGRVAVYDVARFRWSLLPPDSISPRLTQRRVTATPFGPVVTGYADGPLTVADLWDGRRWTRLTTGQTGNDWTWTGRRMLDLQSWYLDTAGQHPPVRPEGGTLDLRSGAWAPLPPDFDRPQSGDGWGVAALGGRRSAVFGVVYDDETARVTTLPRPEGAPDLGTAAVWAGNRLLVFGGTTSGADAHTVDRAWLWTP
jgi:hypothetical protein